jgi:filamentous hemagglutinin family protein
VLVAAGTFAIFASVCLAGRSIANPVGESIRHGNAEFIREGNNLFIHQGSSKLVVDWKDFSIGEGQLTKFLQPGSDAAVLNRVFGGNPSALYGSLEANGKVYLINPNGVFVGPSGRVKAGSFVASSLSVSDDEFLAGKELTFSGSSDSGVVNMGKITALDGDVFLIAKSVENHGTIVAQNGTAGLVGATEVILQPQGQEKVGVIVSSGDGKAQNSGKVLAAQAELKAAGGNLYALAIQNSGTVRATGVAKKGGRVFLRANSGTIQNTGTVSARSRKGRGGQLVMGSVGGVKDLTDITQGPRIVNSGTLNATGARGGLIRIDGQEVVLEKTSKILAIGAEGAGGEISIQGGQHVSNASGSLLDASGLQGGTIDLRADGQLSSGGDLFARGTSDQGGSIGIDVQSANISGGKLDVSGSKGGLIRFDGSDIIVGHAALASDGVLGGGEVRAVATNSMDFHGSISATGSVAGSSGGFAEVSGLISLNYQGSADLRSGSGAAGSLLLDPSDFTIDSSNAGAITGSLVTSNVVIATNSVGTGNGDIFVNAPLLYSSANSLSLLAHRHIVGNASIQNAGVGDVSLVAGWDGFTGAAGSAFDVIRSNPASFGNASGTITIGTGNQTGGVAIGSRFGKTNAAASGMTLTGSGAANRAYAQLGYATAYSSGANVAGSIQVVLRDNLVITGGESNFSYAQIGHGGDSSQGSFAGDIGLDVGGTVQITGGVNFAYAQVGHGGQSTQGAMSGDVTIRTASLNITGGTRPNAFVMIGHGDAVGGSSGARSGAIRINVGGEGTLMNGPASNAIWMIGNRTTTNGGVTNSPVDFGSGALDYSGSTLASQVNLNQDFVGKFAENLKGGNVTIRATGSGSLILGGTFDYVSPNQLTLAAAVSALLNNSITNQGTGELVVIVDAANSVRPIYNPAASLTIASTANLLSGGGVRVFATEPNQTALGGFVPLRRQYNAWFGDAVSVIGVNYKFQPILTLTADNFSKPYGQVLDLSGGGFAVAGLQPGDSLGQVLSGTPVLQSVGSLANATVSGSPYPVLFASGLSTNFGYGLALNPGALTVTPAVLTITASNQSKVYGNTLVFGGTEFTTSGLFNGDTVSLVSLSSAGATETATVGGSPYVISIANAAGSGLGNYSISYVPGSLNVTPGSLFVTPVNQTKVYGSAFAFTGQEFGVAGLVNGDKVNTVSLSSAGAVATAGVVGSPYAISGSNALGSGLSN